VNLTASASGKLNFKFKLKVALRQHQWQYYRRQGRRKVRGLQLSLSDTRFKHRDTPASQCQSLCHVQTGKPASNHNQMA
jgi:hypothetical protein